MDKDKYDTAKDLVSTLVQQFVDDELTELGQWDDINPADYGFESWDDFFEHVVEVQSNVNIGIYDLDADDEENADYE